MGKKKKKKYGSRQTRFCMCDWCAEQFTTTRSDTKTCGGRCRQRMAWFIRHAGYAPDTPPGPKTASDALELEVMRLLRAEKLRREALGTARNK